MTESSTRAQLRAANANLETATKELAQAEVLAKRAVTQKELATAAVQNSMVTSGEVIQWRISALKTGSSDPMPADLIEARREGALAQENLEHAEAVLTHLNLEYEAAQENLKSAEKAKADAVNAVVVERAKSLIADLADLNERRHHLRLVLQGLNLGAGAEAGRVAGNLIHTGLQDNVSDLPMDHSPVKKAEAYWKSFSASLENNAESAPGEYPSWQSLWS